MAWHRTGGKPLAETNESQLYWRINASPSRGVSLKIITALFHFGNPQPMGRQPSFESCIIIFLNMMTSSNGNIFRVTGHSCGEFTGHRWIPCTKASDAELWCFLSLICTWINAWVNNSEGDDLRRQHAHYDVTVMRTATAYHRFDKISIECIP